MQRKLIAFAAAAAILGNALGASAQEDRRKFVITTPPQEEDVLIAQGPAGVAPPAQTEIRGDNLVFVATEMSFSGKLVKGAPYSAQAVTETVQQLSDGNRIVRRNTAQVYRDSEGRTRRDQTLGYIGPYAAQGDPPQTVFINDPVSGVHYILDPAKKTARKLPRFELHFKAESDAVAAAEERKRVVEGAVEKIEIERTFTRVPAPGAPPAPPSTAVVVAPPPPGEGMHFEFLRHSSKHEAKTEKLEARSFDGVTAEGTRTTTTIPAGEIGNEQPIQIVDERWYSPELQVVVMTRHSDPRAGETTYRLTNISRAEPSSALFQVPGDYAVRDTTPPAGVRRARRPAAPAAPPQELD
ncbi:MAG TPA: hypothetical protein VF668_15745 [Pyrinomonadaceae bacterium]|jgi:hypothetical protein